MVFITGPISEPVGIRAGTASTGPSFFGNPNADVTSVNTAGGIVKSRPSGLLPAFVQVSASAITASGPSWLNAYEDLDYSWNFGDPNGTQFFTDPTTGLTVNANSDQTGPEAVYVYTVANTYTITLTIKWRNAGVLNQTSVVTTFQANTFTPLAEYYIDPVGGNDFNAGTSSGAAWKTATNLRAVNWNSKRINIKRGTTLTDHFGRLQSRQSVRIQSYGDPSAADPIVTFNTNANSGHIMWSDTGGGSFIFPMLDWVIQDVEWAPTGTCTDGPYFVGAVNNAGCYIQDIYFMGCTFRSNPGLTQNLLSLSNFNTPGAGFDNQRVGCWDCSCYGQVGSLDGAERMGLAMQGWNDWLFVVGGHLEGNGQDNIHDHHIYPIFQRHGLFRWIDFGTGTHKSHCINTDWNNNGTVITCTAGTIDNGAGTGAVAGSVFTPAGTISGTFAVGQVPNASGMSSNAYFLSADLGGGQWRVTARDTGANASLALTPRAINCTPHQNCEYIVYDGCSFGGVRYSIDADDFNNNYNLATWRNQVLQKCDFRSDLAEAGILAFSITSISIRDCESWTPASVSDWYNPGTMGYYILNDLAFRLYRNKFYVSVGRLLSFSTSGGIPVTAPQMLQFTDNECYLPSTNAVALLVKASDLGSSSIIDRNKYYAPNDSDGKIFLQNGTAETLATWKTHGANFDPTSTDTKPPFPNWIDPANGNFNT